MSNHFIEILLPAVLLALLAWGCLTMQKLRRSRNHWRESFQRASEERDECRMELHGRGKRTTAGWREIAFYHSKDSRRLREKLLAYSTECDNWRKQFRHLVVFIWGEPPLDRSVLNVCEHIQALRDQCKADALKKQGLAAAYEELSRRLTSAGAENLQRQSELAEAAHTIEALRSELKRCGNHDNLDWLVAHGLGVVRDEQGAAGEDSVYILPVQTTGTPVGTGANIAEAIEDARLTMRRRSEGLSS